MFVVVRMAMMLMAVGIVGTGVLEIRNAPHQADSEEQSQKQHHAVVSVKLHLGQQVGQGDK